MNLPQHIIILALRAYRWCLSPLQAFLFGPLARCRFEPSCSCYTLEAVQVHGAIKGTFLGLKRVCRCHPWGGCGWDPVPPQLSPLQSSGSNVLSGRSSCLRPH